MQSLRISDVKLVDVLPLVAIMMIMIMVVPSSLWNHPLNDAKYDGFDPNLIYMNENGGLIRVTPDVLELSAVPPESNPYVHLLTTPFDKLKINFDVQILNNEPSTYPLRIDLWSARNGSGYFLEFCHSPDNLLRSGVIIDGVANQILAGGSEIKSEIVGV